VPIAQHAMLAWIYIFRFSSIKFIMVNKSRELEMITMMGMLTTSSSLLLPGNPYVTIPAIKNRGVKSAREIPNLTKKAEVHT